MAELPRAIAFLGRLSAIHNKQSVRMNMRNFNLIHVMMEAASEELDALYIMDDVPPPPPVPYHVSVMEKALPWHVDTSLDDNTIMVDTADGPVHLAWNMAANGQ